MLGVNTVISRGANEITSFHPSGAADHRCLLLRLRLQLHSEGLKVVYSATKGLAVGI